MENIRIPFEKGLSYSKIHSLFNELSQFLVAGINIVAVLAPYGKSMFLLPLSEEFKTVLKVLNLLVVVRVYSFRLDLFTIPLFNHFL